MGRLFLLGIRPIANLRGSCPDDWNRFQFEGRHSFSDAKLRAALVAEPDFLLANHPKSDNAQVHEVTKRLLLSGYKQAGFPDAKIEVQTDPSGLTTINVVGRAPLSLWRRTSRRCQANRLFITHRILDDSSGQTGCVLCVLRRQRQTPGDVDEPKRQSPGSLKPRWKLGSPAPLGTEKKLQSAVETALKSMGFATTDFTVTIELNETQLQADLVIDLRSEGSQDRMDRIVIDGCRQHRPEQIIEFLGLQSGQPYDRQQMQLIAERLWNCARFHKYQLRLDRDAGGGCTLRITLNETPGVPILSEPLSEVAEAMLKTRAWLSECDNRGEDLVFRIQKGAARCLLIQSRSGMIVQTQGTGSQDAAGSSLTPSSLLVDGDQLLLALGDSTNHWSAPIANYPGVIRFELGLGAAETDDKFAILNLGFNFHSQRTPHSPLLVHNLNLTPAAWCAFAYKPDCKVETTDQTITLSRATSIRFRLIARPGNCSALNRLIIN